jgi:hypothetical protein
VNGLRHFKKNEDGVISVEFVLLFPVLMMIFFVAFEVGLWNMREVMLRRAVNIVVRDIRLNTAAPPTYDEMKTAICERTTFVEGCEAALRIEMQALPLDAWANIDDKASCVDRRDEVEPQQTFTPGGQNELMIVRVCRLFEPLFPGVGLGQRLAEDADGEYGLRVTAGFVTEPL